MSARVVTIDAPLAAPTPAIPPSMGTARHNPPTPSPLLPASQLESPGSPPAPSLLWPPSAPPLHPSSAAPPPLMTWLSTACSGVLLLVMLLVLHLVHSRRNNRMVRAQELTAYRATLESELRPDSPSSLSPYAPPLDAAIASGELLQLRPSIREQEPLCAGMYCRAVGGTCGRPQVRLLGLSGDRVVCLSVERGQLERACLPPEADEHAIAVEAAARYAAALAACERRKAGKGDNDDGLYAVTSRV